MHRPLYDITKQIGIRDITKSNFEYVLAQEEYRPLVRYDLPPPEEHVFFKAYCLANILQYVSPLAIGALSSTSLLHLSPLKTYIII